VLCTSNDVCGVLEHKVADHGDLTWPKVCRTCAGIPIGMNVYYTALNWAFVIVDRYFAA
jgi:hypothetical protein